MNRAAADLLGMDCNCLSEKTALDFYETANKRSGILGHLSRENSVQVRRLELLLNGVLMNVSAALKLINIEDQEFVFTLVTGTSPASREKEAVMAGSLLSSSEDLVVVTDPGGCILYVNPAFEHITGFSSEELIGKNPSLWKSNLFGQDFYAGMYHQLKDEGVFRSEFMNLKKNGEAYFEDKTIVCVRDHEGRLLYYLSTGRDITGRKREEKRLAMQFAITSIFSSAPSSDAAVYGVLEELRQHGEWDLAEFWKMESSRIRLDVARSDGS
ncbi:MAG TPA: PAS domain S-box protein, partial [Leptospiraceae bacterium]|nr:PAS domain S-box protein [Leptospiraceae bacterium]